MEMELAQDRRSVRRAVDLSCYVIRVPSLEVVGERALELSPHGMLVLSDAPCEIGETLLVSFDVPGTDRTITTSARVARLARGRRSTDSGKAIGVEIDGLEADTERMLRMALEPLPETTPARPARVDYAGTVQMIALTVDY